MYNFGSVGGNYKNSDNIIEEENESVEKSIRFVPVPAYLTKDIMEIVCDHLVESLKNKSVDPLILIPVSILDFLCIHPFNERNAA